MSIWQAYAELGPQNSENMLRLHLKSATYQVHMVVLIGQNLIYIHAHMLVCSSGGKTQTRRTNNLRSALQEPGCRRLGKRLCYLKSFEVLIIDASFMQDHSITTVEPSCSQLRSELKVDHMLCGGNNAFGGKKTIIMSHHLSADSWKLTCSWSNQRKAGN